MARSTVTEAYEQLIAEGYLESARGSGTFVCRELPDGMLPSVSGLAGESPPIRLSRFGSSLDYDYERGETAAGVISFPPGTPDLHAFPFGLWRKLLMRHLREASADVFDYTDYAAGLPALRTEIAAYVSRVRAVRATPEQVVVVNGSQQGLGLCARVLLEPGDEVGLENPGYQGARRIFQAFGAQLRGMTIDEEGASIGDLRRSTRMVYVTPSHQFPTGVSMSLARRLELIAWARANAAAIVEDDYSSEYRYSGPPLPSLQGLAQGVPVIYIGTFSKVMFPGLRLGYVVVPRSLEAPFRRAKWLEDRNTPILEQKALADFMREGHLDRHVRRMRRLYGRRREALVAALERHFGEGVEILGDPAGMHLMVRFRDTRIGERAARNRVKITASAGYYLGDGRKGEFLMGFSAIGEKGIKEGVRRLS